MFGDNFGSNFRENLVETLKLKKQMHFRLDPTDLNGTLQFFMDFLYKRFEKI